MQRLKDSADRDDALKKQATEAQVSLAESYLKQIEISNKSSQINILNSKISARYKSIEIYTNEISRISESISLTKASDVVYTINGERLISRVEKRDYIEIVAKKIEAENGKVAHYMNMIEHIR